MEFITYLQTGLLSAVETLLANYAGAVEAESLSQMEVQVQEMSRAVGQAALTDWLGRQAPKYPADSVPCACGGEAHFERQREAMTITLQGRVTYRRAYYRCACGQGQCPLDARLGLRPGQMSEHLTKVAGHFGVREAFEHSADSLAETLGVRLSPNSVRAACQQLGQQIEAHEAELSATSHDPAAQLEHRRSGPRPRCLYGSLDGFHGRFEDGWHEVKAGSWWQVDAKGRAYDIHYYADTGSVDTFSPLMWARGFERGADQAQQLVFVADGAAWIWRLVQAHFPKAIQIVDWYHACAYLVKVAQTAFGEGTPAARDWLTQQKTALYTGKLASILRACRAQTERAAAAVADLRHYFAANRTRLRYGKFRALGLQIGSGTMESGCKQLGDGRLKLSGARWSPHGARLVVKARAAFLSHEISLPPLAALQVA